MCALEFSDRVAILKVLDNLVRINAQDLVFSNNARRNVFRVFSNIFLNFIYPFLGNKSFTSLVFLA